MQQIILFFIRNKNFLLFTVLFIISVLLTIHTHNYHRNSFMSSANHVIGNLFTVRNNATDYFGLGKENQILLEENMALREKVQGLKQHLSSEKIDTNTVSLKYKYFSAKVINNNYSHTKNHLTIDKGRNDSIQIDLGVISSKGLVGIVSGTSKKYATIQSILNTKSRINAKLKASNHFGTLIWDTKDPNLVQLIDIPRLAQLKKGDTIVTGGRSTIFPEGIDIGTIEDFRLDQDDNYHYITVLLFNDMTSLEHVYLIKNYDAEEIITLEKEIEDAE